MTRVVHCKRENFDIYVGRPSEWGNPYSHKEGTLAKYMVHTREQAVECFSDWIHRHPGLVGRIKSELAGKTLGCWCRPRGGFNGQLMCHAQVLAGIADGIPPGQVE